MLRRVALVVVGVGAAAAAAAYASTPAVAPNPPPVPANKSRLIVIGYPLSPPTAHAHYLVDELVKSNPSTLCNWYGFSWSFWKIAQEHTKSMDFAALGRPELRGHDTSPFVYCVHNRTEAAQPGGGAAAKTTTTIELIGGDAELSKWVLAKAQANDSSFRVSSAAEALARTPLTLASLSKAWHVNKGRPVVVE